MPNQVDKMEKAMVELVQLVATKSGSLNRDPNYLRNTGMPMLAEIIERQASTLERRPANPIESRKT